jgi:hypothetical protein
LNKASIAFKYLTALGAIEVTNEKFEANLKRVEDYLNNDDWPLAEYWVNRVEDYLNNDDWPLAEYWVNRIQKEYTELFFNRF